MVHLDGTASSDPNSTPGTNDDIVLYEWLEHYGSAGERLLGTGAVIDVLLPLGTHGVTLRVTDSFEVSATDNVEVTIFDSAAPHVSLDLDPAMLWPPTREMVPITAEVSSRDACGATSVVLTSITSSESDDEDASGDVADAAFGTADFEFELRAERAGSGPGREYVITYTSTDASGNSATARGRVVVPHDRSRNHSIAPELTTPSRSSR